MKKKLLFLFSTMFLMLFTFTAKAQDEPEGKAEYDAAMAAIEDGGTYRVFTEVGEAKTKYYLNASGYLVDNTAKAAIFTFNQATKEGTLFPKGWNLGCKFTNPTMDGSNVKNDGI